MSTIPPLSDGGASPQEEVEHPREDVSHGPTDLLPLHQPTRVSSEHLGELPGAEQTAAVDWVRLPHWRLVRQLQSGDQEALAWIIETYRTPLLRYARRLLAGSADPDDIVQEAFFRLWSRRASLRPAGSIRAFLFISVRTIARDEYRRWGRRRRGQKRGPDFEGRASDDPSEDLHGSELLRSLREAVEALSPRRREVFRLVREEGLSIDETARVLNLTPRTIKNTMSAALAELREKLGPFLK